MEDNVCYDILWRKLNEKVGSYGMKKFGGWVRETGWSTRERSRCTRIPVVFEVLIDKRVSF
jgi:hypothetical protein